MPSLERTNHFLAANNSPSLPMLKFLDIVLSDIYILGVERRNHQINMIRQQQTNNIVMTPDQ